jgi:hypothetical protein
MQKEKDKDKASAAQPAASSHISQQHAFEGPGEGKQGQARVPEGPQAK